MKTLAVSCLVIMFVGCSSAPQLKNTAVSLRDGNEKSNTTNRKIASTVIPVSLVSGMAQDLPGPNELVYKVSCLSTAPVPPLQAIQAKKINFASFTLVGATSNQLY